MSNGVGKLYEMIIDGVIHEAQVDFENLGVSQQTLQLLKSEWQKRLSAMNVASYLPWDMNERWGNVPQQPVYYNAYDLGMSSGMPAPLPSGMPSGMGAAASSIPSGMPTLGGTPAAAPSASAPIALKQEDFAQYPQDIPHVPQTDGVQVRAPKEPKASAESAQASEPSPMLTQTDLLDVIAEKMAEIQQADGTGEEVGSDLDDSEDDLNSEEEEGDNGMVMLCLYEKVQRVKNKWKFTFKDGVATINGADYVFSRGTGEAEW